MFLAVSGLSMIHSFLNIILFKKEFGVPHSEKIKFENLNINSLEIVNYMLALYNLQHENESKTGKCAVDFYCFSSYIIECVI